MNSILILLWLPVFALRVISSTPTTDFDLFDGALGSYPSKRFFSSSLRPPRVNFLQWTSGCDDGKFTFITPKGHKVTQPGPMILDDHGELIWAEHFKNDYGGQAYDLKVQRYHGEDYLTFWLGDDTVHGHGAGHFYMLNSSYDIVRKIGATHSLYADLHDLVITPEGTALTVIFQPIKADVRPVGRKLNDIWNQAVWDCVFQEIDIESEKLLFEWRASEHLNLNLTYHKVDSFADVGTGLNPLDWFHINSVQKDGLGNYLVSARNLHAIFYICGKTKKILWTLGGKGNDFQDLSDGHVLNFAWQHDAHFHPEGTFSGLYTAPATSAAQTTRLLTLFDNAALDWDYSYGPTRSRGLLLEITYPTSEMPIANQAMHALGTIKREASGNVLGEMLSEQDFEKVKKINGSDPRYTVRLVHEYIHPRGVISSTQGSIQVLPQSGSKDPEILIGYGINPVVTKFSSNGTVVCDMHFGARTSWEKGDVQSYRAQKHRWIGQPRKPPSAVVVGQTVYASWNGATEYSEWLLQASDVPRGGEWKEIARVPRQGFETAISTTETHKYMRVLALNATGQICEHGVGIITKRGLLDSVNDIDAGVTLLDLAIYVVGSGLVFSGLVWAWGRIGSQRRSRGRYDLLPRQRGD